MKLARFDHLREGDRLELVWLDAHRDSSWERPDEIDAELSRVRSVGYFVKANADVVVLAMDRSDGLVNGLGILDRRRVVELHELERR